MYVVNIVFFECCIFQGGIIGLAGTWSRGDCGRNCERRTLPYFGKKIREVGWFFIFICMR